MNVKISAVLELSAVGCTGRNRLSFHTFSDPEHGAFTCG
jgi:hypothetical protein